MKKNQQTKQHKLVKATNSKLKLSNSTLTEVVRRVAAGQTTKQIVSSLGLKLGTVRKIRSSERFKQALSEYVNELDERTLAALNSAALPQKEVLRMAGLEAAFKLIDLMRSSLSEEMQFKAAKTIYDESKEGNKPTEAPTIGGNLVFIDSFEQKTIQAGLDAVKQMANNEANGTAYLETTSNETNEEPLRESALNSPKTSSPESTLPKLTPKDLS